MIAPLHIPDLPMKGPTGERDNLARLFGLQSALLPPGRVLVMDVAHDAGCPCEDSAAAIDRCTCDTVDVTLHAHDPRES